MDDLTPLPGTLLARREPGPVVPAIVAAAGDQAAFRYLELFAAQMRNANSRRAYLRAVGGFFAWLEAHGVTSIADVTSLHIGAYIEAQGKHLAAPTVKQQLAAIRRLFAWLAAGNALPYSPATAVRGPSHSVKVGKTTVLAPTEARQLLDSIDTTTPAGLRDRALIGLMVYSLARVGAALGMKVEDVFSKNRRLWVRLTEKGSKHHEMPCHHNLEDYLHAYIDGCGLAAEPKGMLFRTIQGRSGTLSGSGLQQSEAYRMIGRRAKAAGITTKAGNHTFRATGITAYLKAGGTLERAAAMANHASTRTTQLYDRRAEDVTLDEVERIGI